MPKLWNHYCTGPQASWAQVTLSEYPNPKLEHFTCSEFHAKWFPTSSPPEPALLAVCFREIGQVVRTFLTMPKLQLFPRRCRYFLSHTVDSSRVLISWRTTGPRQSLLESKCCQYMRRAQQTVPRVEVSARLFPLGRGRQTVEEMRRRRGPSLGSADSQRIPAQRVARGVSSKLILLSLYSCPASAESFECRGRSDRPAPAYFTISKASAEDSKMAESPIDATTACVRLATSTPPTDARPPRLP